MKVFETELNGVVIIEPTVFSDNRGFFMESYNAGDMEKCGFDQKFVQDNHSWSEEAGTLRGLHYQTQPMGQTKLVRVVTGAIFDVVVDIRPNSKTFGKWTSALLTVDNHRQLLVPKGFAHGFCTLVDSTHVLYKVDNYYSKQNDRGIAWNDPDIGINWPMTEPILSEKDRNNPRLSELNDLE